MELKTAKQELKPYRMSIRHTGEDYRVNFDSGKEATAYYTDSIEDAVKTGKVMREQQTRLERNERTGR